MKLRRLIYFLIVLQSCNLIIPPIEPVEEQYIYINIANNELKPATKGTPIVGEDNLKENTLESLYIILFNKTRNQRLRNSDVYVTTWSSGMVSIATNTLNNYSASDIIKVYVIANTYNNAHRNALQACTTIDQIENLLETNEYNRHLTLSGGYYQPATPTNSKVFMMEAHDEVLMNINRYPFASLTLRRLAVKVRLSLILDDPEITVGVPDPYFGSWAGDDIRYQLVNTARTTRLVNTGTPCKSSDRNFATTTYRALNYDPVTHTDESVFYSLENEWVQNNVNETFLRLTIPYYNMDGVKIDSNYYKIRFNVDQLRRNDFFDILATIKLIGSPVMSDPVLLPDARVAVVQDWDSAIIDIYQQADHIWVSSTKLNMYGAAGYFRMSSSRTPTFRSYFVPVDEVPAQDAASVTYLNYVLANRNKIYVNLVDTLVRFQDPPTLRVDIQAGILKKSLEYTCYPASYFYMDQDSVVHNHILMTPVAEPPFMSLGAAIDEGTTSITASANEMVNYSLQIANTIATCVNNHNDAGARTYCSNYTQDGFNDWRVPTLAEMKLIMLAREKALSKNVNDPFYRTTAFPINVNYWTAKSAGEGQGTATLVYAINIPSGVETALGLGQTAYVRCVRALNN